MADQAPASRQVTPAPMPAAAELSLAASIDETYPAVVESVPRARASVARWLRALGTDEVLEGDVALAVFEACTNAVVHGHRNGTEGSFRIVVRGGEDLVRVTVIDDGCGMAPRPDSPGLGLGLPLMAALSDSLRVRSTAGGTGTVVSMTFTAAGARARTPADRRASGAPPRA
jgi:anti-sigma regulatory factor (Ser/Thr protein kinase)